jgi:hypothetical protein
MHNSQGSYGYPHIGRLWEETAQVAPSPREYPGRVKNRCFPNPAASQFHGADRNIPRGAFVEKLDGKTAMRIVKELDSHPFVEEQISSEDEARMASIQVRLKQASPPSSHLDDLSPLLVLLEEVREGRVVDRTREKLEI